MIVVFQNGQKYVTWNLPIARREDEEAIFGWAVKNKSTAEGINSAAQIIRLLQGIKS